MAKASCRACGSTVATVAHAACLGGRGGVICLSEIAGNK